jgi:hypothetical protein
MSSDPVQKLIRLLGSSVVFINWPRGVKGAKHKWKNLAAANMTPEYLAKLPQGNIGVALGAVSGGLCVIDIDRDELVKPFLALNPQLKKTLQTHGARGRAFWFRCKGEYPQRTAKLKTHSGDNAGELRSNGSQSIVWGIHPDTQKPYKFVVKLPVVEIEFSSIQWPAEIKNPPSLNSASCVSASLLPCVPTYSTSLHNKIETVLANITARNEAQTTLTAKHPQLARLYTELIEPRFQARAHGRNNFIVAAVPFLYRAVAPKFVLELVGCFYGCNRALFNDPREQHMKEAAAMLESVAKTYVESLTADERKIYDALPEPEQDTFRICRDLALLKTPEREPLTFYLSFGHLADRLGIFPMQAQRIMRQFESDGLIQLLKKGTRRAAGKRGEAGSYQWLVSL